jgi:hypothetical protein
VYGHQRSAFLFLSHVFGVTAIFLKEDGHATKKGERHLSFSKPYEMNGFCKIIAMEETWGFACTGKDDRAKNH